MRVACLSCLFLLGGCFAELHPCHREPNAFEAILQGVQGVGAVASLVEYAAESAQAPRQEGQQWNQPPAPMVEVAASPIAPSFVFGHITLNDDGVSGDRESIENSTLTLFRGRARVAQTVVERDGMFAFPERVPPGQYQIALVHSIWEARSTFEVAGARPTHLALIARARAANDGGNADQQ